MTDNKTFQEERLRGIMKILETENRVLINNLSKVFNTTPVTIRKDLDQLEKEGLVKRTHGGAVPYKTLFHGLALHEKEGLHAEEKKRIAMEAVKLISEGDVIMLDSGSTTTQLAKNMKNIKNITVITNAINIAIELSESEAEIILTGGSLQKDSSTLIGPLAEDVLNKVSADKLFQGADGIDYDIGVTAPNINEASTSRVMMRRAGETILLVDSSKFGRRSLGVVCEIQKVDKIITTKELDKQELKKLTNLGVEVIIV